MRTTHPLSEILESTLRLEEPLMDTDWPAGDVQLEAPKPPEPQFRVPAGAFRPGKN